MKKTVRILVADDHIMLRKGIRSMLESQEDFVPLLHEVENGAGVLDAISKHKFDILLLDVKMPRTDGLAVIKALRGKKCCTPVIALCSTDELNYINQAIQVGVQGIILKSSGKEELVKAIKTVVDDVNYYSNEITQIILRMKMNGKKVKVKKESLTRRERQILTMLANEYSSAEIALELGISSRTVEGHRNKLKEKLNVKSTVGLVKFALEAGQYERLGSMLWSK